MKTAFTAAPENFRSVPAAAAVAGLEPGIARPCGRIAGGRSIAAAATPAAAPPPLTKNSRRELLFPLKFRFKALLLIPQPCAGEFMT
jgi:hypothetical protein